MKDEIESTRAGDGKSADTEREAFEAKAKSLASPLHLHSFEREGDYYVEPAVRIAWWTWQQAQQALADEAMADAIDALGQLDQKLSERAAAPAVSAPSAREPLSEKHILARVAEMRPTLAGASAANFWFLNGVRWAEGKHGIHAPAAPGFPAPVTGDAA